MSEFHQNWSNNRPKTIIEKYNYWKKLGFLDHIESSRFDLTEKSLQFILIDFYEEAMSLEDTEYIIPCIRRIICQAFKNYEKYADYCEISWENYICFFTVEELNLRIKTVFETLLQQYKKLFRYSDVECLLIANICENCCEEIVFLNRIRISNPDLFKKELRERKLKTIL